MQHMSEGGIICWGQGCAANAVPAVASSGNLELGQGADDSSHTLGEGYYNIEVVLL